MKRLVAVLVIAALGACTTPPKPPQPTGEWVPVNRLHNDVGSKA
jgi:hypothetical protein